MATRPRKFTEFGTGENVDVRERENSLRPLLGESECESGRGVLLRWDERMGVTVDGRVLFFGEILLFFKIIHVARTTFRQGTLDPRQSKNDTRRVVVESSSFVPSAREDSIATPGKGKFFRTTRRAYFLDRSCREPPFRFRATSTGEFVSSLQLTEVEAGREEDTEKVRWRECASTWRSKWGKGERQRKIEGSACERENRTFEKQNKADFFKLAHRFK